MTAWLTLWLIGVILAAVPFVAAMPWLAAVDLDNFKTLARQPKSWGWSFAGLAGAGLLLALLLGSVQDQERLQLWGRTYGSIVQILLTADLFVVVFLLLASGWPRGGAVALAAFREGMRQPLFWLLAAASAFLILVSLLVPYFTFGDDYKMMKHIGFDIVMLFTALFAVITASMSISEEIEGRTAVTLLSKPLSRRQFLLGKFAGILLAGLALTALAGWCLNWALYAKPILDLEDMNAPSRRLELDPLQEQIQPLLLAFAQRLATQREAVYFLEGVAGWSGSSLALLPGLLTGLSQVMLFLAIAAAMATRLPMVINLLTCLVLFFLGNLAPYLVRVAQNLQLQYRREHQGLESTAIGLVQFVARLFDTVLPALEYFGMGPAVVRDQPLPLGPYMLHVLLVIGYSVLYSSIALLVGLLLFEDRDLA